MQPHRPRVVIFFACLFALLVVIFASILLGADENSNSGLSLIQFDASHVEFDVDDYVRQYTLHHLHTYVSFELPWGPAPRRDIYYRAPGGGLTGRLDLAADYFASTSHNHPPLQFTSNKTDIYPATYFDLGVPYSFNDNYRLNETAHSEIELMLRGMDQSMISWRYAGTAILDPGAAAPLLIAGAVLEAVGVAGLVAFNRLAPGWRSCVVFVTVVAALLFTASAGLITKAIYSLVGSQTILDDGSGTIFFKSSPDFLHLTWTTCGFSLLVALLSGLALVLARRVPVVEASEAKVERESPPSDQGSAARV